MAKTKISNDNSQYQKSIDSKANAIQAYSSSEEIEESEESSVNEEGKEQFPGSDDEQAAATSYNESFLNKNDFTSEEIKEYKSSLIHDEDRVRERLNRVVAMKGKLNVVMIAEKPNIAELISQALSEGKYSKNIWEGFKSYHFNNLKFKGFRANCTVLSVYGNVYEYDFDRRSDILKRDPFDILLNDPIYIYRTKFKNEKRKGKKKDNKARKRVNLEYLEEYLAYYLIHANALVFWMDWDKVGENIWVQVTEFIKNCIKGFPLENIFRAEFFSLKHQQIQKSWENLRLKIDESKSLGVYARMKIDLKLGLSYSVLNTNRLAKFFKEDNKGKSRVSYGPCQFPTFWFWYERMWKIKNFKPRVYWSPVIQIVVAEKEVKLTYKDNEISSEYEARNILITIKNQKSKVIVKQVDLK